MVHRPHLCNWNTVVRADHSNHNPRCRILHIQLQSINLSHTTDSPPTPDPHDDIQSTNPVPYPLKRSSEDTGGSRVQFGNTRHSFRNQLNQRIGNRTELLTEVLVNHSWSRCGVNGCYDFMTLHIQVMTVTTFRPLFCVRRASTNNSYLGVKFCRCWHIVIKYANLPYQVPRANLIPGSVAEMVVAVVVCLLKHPVIVTTAEMGLAAVVELPMTPVIVTL